MARYHVKSATLKFGETAFEMANGPAAKGETREAVDVTSLADTVKKFIPGAVKELDEFTVTLFDKGSGMPTVDDKPAKLEISVTLSDGENADVSAKVEYPKAIVTKVAPPSQEATGDRKATVDVTFKPNGEVGA